MIIISIFVDVVKFTHLILHIVLIGRQNIRIFIFKVVKSRKYKILKEGDHHMNLKNYYLTHYIIIIKQ